MARGMKDLKKEYKGREMEYQRFAKKITMTYLTTPIEYSQSEVGKEFNITSSTVRKLMDYAIINCLVTKEDASRIMNKSKQNQQRKHTEAGGSSIRHHLDLMKKREDFIAATFEEIAILEIVSKVVYGVKNIEDMAAECGIESQRLLWLILKRAIVENIASDKELDIITQKCYKNGITLKKIECFRNLIEKRKEFKKTKK